MRKIPTPIAFEWDDGNSEKNLLKHHVEKKEAEEVFYDALVKMFEDTKHSQDEQRYVALGVTHQGRKLSLVFTIRKSRIRIISARNQSRKERNLYEKK